MRRCGRIVVKERAFFCARGENASVRCVRYPALQRFTALAHQCFIDGLRQLLLRVRLMCCVNV